MTVLILVVVFAYLLPAFLLWKLKKKATELFDLGLFDVIAVILPIFNVLDLISLSAFLLMEHPKGKEYNKKFAKRFFGIKKVDE